MLNIEATIFRVCEERVERVGLGPGRRETGLLPGASSVPRLPKAVDCCIN